MSSVALYGSSLLLLLAWLVSNHYPPWVASHSELLAAVAAALALGAALAGSRVNGLRVPRAALFLAALALVPLVQAAAGQVVFFGDAWIAALYLAGAACCVAASAEVASRRRPDWPALLALTLVAGAVLSSWIAWVQALQVHVGFLEMHVMGVRRGNAPYANLGQPNQLATLLALGVAGLCHLFETKRISRRVAFAAAAWLVVTMALTLSRTSLLLFMAAGITLWLCRRRLPLRTTVPAVVALAATWAVAYFFQPVLTDSLGLTSGATIAGRAAAGPRTVIWSQLWDAVWLHPWVGYGWNQVSMAQIAVAADHPVSRLVEHSHNLALDLRLWNGVPLAVLVMGAGCAWLVHRMRRIRTATGVFGFLVIGLLLAHSMVEFPLDYLYFLVPFGFALGLVEADTGGLGGPSLPWPMALGGTVLVAGLIGGAAWDYWQVEAAYLDMRFTVARIGRPMVTQAPPPPRTQFTQLAAFHTFSLTTPRRGMSEAEMAWMRNIAHRYSYAPSLYRYALAQALNGDLDGARLTMCQLRQLHGDVRYREGKRELLLLADTDYPFLKKLELP